MPQISQEEYDHLCAAAAERDQLAAAPAAAAEAEPDGPPPDTHVALLAGGETHTYSGAHPTEVSSTGPDGQELITPVVAVHPIA